MRLFLIILLVLFQIGCALIPAQTQKPSEAVVCTYAGGYSLGRDREPYDNSCSSQSEPLFLVGYSIARKVRWTEAEMSSLQKHRDCLVLEKDLKFSGTLSPIHINLGDDEDKVKKELSQRGCSSDVFRSSSGIADDIAKDDQLISNYQKKLTALQTLNSRILNNPSGLQKHIQQYSTEMPLDAKDIGFRWNTYVEGKGGVGNLEQSEKQMLLLEVMKKPALSSDVINGAYIGFGLAQNRQNRSSWHFVALDSAIFAGLLYAAATKNTDLGLPLLVFGVPLSRAYQFIDAYQYNLDHGIDVQNLRTDNSQRPVQISFAVEF